MSDAHAPALERRSRAARAAPAEGHRARQASGKACPSARTAFRRPPAFRRAAIETLQTALASGRDEARKALEDGGTGRACAEALSAADRRPFARRARNVLALARPGSPANAADHRRGRGFGRGMLAPFSDIDLLFLLPDKPPPGVEKVVESLLYVLWDLKLKVGHATRTVDECLKQARADMTIRTTLIEARLVIGDKDLFETLQRGSTPRSSRRRRPNSSPRNSRNVKRACAARARRAIWSSPTSKRAREDCATSTRSSGSRNTSIGSQRP